MIYLLMGHRGVGKTSLLRRIESYGLKHSSSAVRTYDLDAYIESETQTTIQDIFANQGEPFFRELEEKYLFQLATENAGVGPVFIALGAGYEKELPTGAQVLFVKRESDVFGRSFFDRPRLEESALPIQEFKDRYSSRERRYLAKANKVLVIREGVDGFCPGEDHFFRQLFDKKTNHKEVFDEKNGYLTLHSNMSPSWYEGSRFHRLELRDDLLNSSQLKKIFESWPSEKLLLSHRVLPVTEEFEILQKQGALTDWALELGEAQVEAPSVLSLHQRKRGEDWSMFYSRLEAEGKKISPAPILKAAPEINTFSELIQGYRWQQEAPKKRVFLPMHPSGKWKWFRLFMKSKMPINFFRINIGSAQDQPSEIEWLEQGEESVNRFAAILGAPVRSSRTPVEQRDFFQSFNAKVYAIDLNQDEFNQAISFLQELGLVAAAVTSPLKNKAFELCDELTDRARRLKVVNTLSFLGNQVFGDNTDEVGFQTQVDLSSISRGTAIAVWGGGGTLPVIQSVLPEAVLFSARKAKPRGNQPLGVGDDFSPKVVVWANASIPIPKHWKPEVIIDLSYSEASLAREYSVVNGSKYMSGLSMFEAQAKAQRVFWSKILATPQGE